MLRLALLLLAPVLLAGAALAATGPAVEGPTATMRLITAEAGVAEGAGSVSAAVEVALEPGWKTYWRSPGEVGLPPRIDWSASDNVAGADLLFPAPERFTAFEIENFGYEGTVRFPVRIDLERPGEAARLVADVALLVCADICVPETALLTLDLPAGGGVDAQTAALVARAAEAVPVPGADAGLAVAAAHMGADALTVEIAASPPLQAPDLFPEAGRAAFGAPEIVLAEGGARLWARLPVTAAPEEGAPLVLTVVDGARAATMAAAPAAAAPAAPSAGGALLAALGAALLGGLILNAMPCVLPVLGLKLSSVASAAGATRTRIRAGFLATAAGILAFALVLAGLVIAARAMGATLGWGVQFQSPLFLAALVIVLALFAASLLGLWEARLPARWATAMAQDRGGLWGDFAAGAFAAVLATPCSAPFLGTAVAFAFAAGPGATLAVFLALGLGLALPWLALAARPGLVARLPRPGPWMVWVKAAMAGLLALTALWLLSVLAAAAGWPAALAVGVLALAAAAAPLLRVRALPAVGLAGALALAAPLVLPAPEAEARVAQGWAPFARGEIAAHVAAGRTVLVDVTADWCLTCKANKAAVLARAPVADRLAAPEVVPMQADWTRPDPAIAAYLGEWGRAGIPLNVVYGPGAPSGIALPEVLTPGAVTRALDAAGG